MGDADEPSLRSSVKSKASAAIHLGRKKDKQDASALPTHNPHTPAVQHGPELGVGSSSDNNNTFSEKHHSTNNGVLKTSATDPLPVNTAAKGETASSIKSNKGPLYSPARIKDGTLRFLRHTKNALTHSWINLLLVFVPSGH